MFKDYEWCPGDDGEGLRKLIVRKGNEANSEKSWPSWIVRTGRTS